MGYAADAATVGRHTTSRLLPHLMDVAYVARHAIYRTKKYRSHPPKMLKNFEAMVQLIEVASVLSDGDPVDHRVSLSIQAESSVASEAKEVMRLMLEAEQHLTGQAQTFRQFTRGQWLGTVQSAEFGSRGAVCVWRASLHVFVCLPRSVGVAVLCMDVHV